MQDGIRDLLLAGKEIKKLQQEITLLKEGQLNEKLDAIKRLYQMFAVATDLVLKEELNCNAISKKWNSKLVSRTYKLSQRFRTASIDNDVFNLEFGNLFRDILKEQDFATQIYCLSVVQQDLIIDLHQLSKVVDGYSKDGVADYSGIKQIYTNENELEALWNKFMKDKTMSTHKVIAAFASKGQKAFDWLSQRMHDINYKGWAGLRDTFRSSAMANNLKFDPNHYHSEYETYKKAYGWD